MKTLAATFLTLLLSGSMASASLDNVLVKPTFEACENVKIVQSSLSEAQRIEFIGTQHAKGLQRLPKMEFLSGLSDPQSIASSMELLQFVAAQKITNITSHLSYYAEVRTCLENGAVTGSIPCQPLLENFKKSIATATPALRRELALSLNLPIGMNYSAVPRAHINGSLRSVGGLPNPAGGTALSAAEYATAESDFSRDLAVVKQQVQTELSILNVRSSLNDSSLRIELLKTAYSIQALKHQANYTKILLQNPVLGFFPQGLLAVDRPVSTSEFTDALLRLASSGRAEIRSILQTLDRNRLEFARLNGEAIWRGYMAGEVELLQFVTSPVTNEVLKTHPQYCAVAERLLQRVSIKQVQNFVIMNAILGVGPTLGLLDISIQGVLVGAKALGMAEGVSIAGALVVTSRISMAVMTSGSAVRLYRDHQHSQAEMLQEPRLP